MPPTHPPAHKHASYVASLVAWSKQRRLGQAIWRDNPTWGWKAEQNICVSVRRPAHHHRLACPPAKTPRFGRTRRTESRSPSCPKSLITVRPSPACLLLPLLHHHCCWRRARHHHHRYRPRAAPQAGPLAGGKARNTGARARTRIADVPKPLHLHSFQRHAAHSTALD